MSILLAGLFPHESQTVDSTAHGEPVPDLPRSSDLGPSTVESISVTDEGAFSASGHGASDRAEKFREDFCWPSSAKRKKTDADRYREELTDPHHYNMPRFLPRFSHKAFYKNDLRRY